MCKRIMVVIVFVVVYAEGTTISLARVRLGRASQETEAIVGPG